MSPGLATDKNKVRRFQKHAVQQGDEVKFQLATSGTARAINREIVLQLIRRYQPISRADVSRLSGLQRSTVSQIVEQLIEQRWIREGAMGKLPRGRRPTMLLLNDELATLAVDIHPRHAVVAIIDLNGRLLSRSSISLARKPERSVALLVNCMKRMRTEQRLRSLEGVGISVPGRVDPNTKQLIFAPNLSWPPFDIRAAIEREMKLPTEIENAANSCLISELWYGQMAERDVVLITVSEGIGAGIMMNRELLIGRHGLAGEFGHVSLDPSGPRCACNQYGCWETMASSVAAIRYYKQLSVDDAPSTYYELLNRADEGDQCAVEALNKQASHLGIGLRMVMGALSPKVILIAGEVTSAWHRFAPLLEREVGMSPLTKTPPELRPVHDGDLARLRGAAAVLLQRHLVQGPNRWDESSLNP